MPRSTTTGIYTRVDNSFSNPVVGTTISPTDADTFFDDVDAAMNGFLGTSTTSLLIATGSKSFTTQADKSFLVGMFVQAFSQADHANYMYGTVTSYNATTGALVLDVVTTGGSGTLTDWLLITAGARGGTGATGSTGERAGFKYTFNSATSGDPASGKFLFNHATFASATAVNISETDGDSVSLTSFLATLDDSTSTNKCVVVWTNADGSKGFIGYLTGTLTDNGTYDTFSFTPVTTWGSPVNADVFRMTVSRVGDKGTDGAGAGDVVGPGSATDNAAARFDSTTGKLIQNSTVIISDTGDVSGVAKLTTTSTIELGNASDTTLSRASAGVLAVEGVNLTPNIPQNSQSAAYGLVIGDANTHILHPTADNNARTFTIPANASVAYPIGTFVVFVNQINTVTIAITSDTMTLQGAGTTGSRTLAANGVATALKVASTSWIISGTGLS